MVVPNTDLMDNHQGQLATELEKGGYLVVSDIPSVHHLTALMLKKLIRSGLKENIGRFFDLMGKGVKAFPKQEPGRFRGIMDEMMGFEEDRL